MTRGGFLKSFFLEAFVVMIGCSELWHAYWWRTLEGSPVYTNNNVFPIAVLRLIENIQFTIDTLEIGGFNLKKILLYRKNPVYLEKHSRKTRFPVPYVGRYNSF